MFAATAAKVYKDVPTAMKQMGAGFDKVYKPNKKRVKIYDDIYQEYCNYGDLVEQNTK